MEYKILSLQAESLSKEYTNKGPSIVGAYQPPRVYFVWLLVGSLKH